MSKQGRGSKRLLQMARYLLRAKDAAIKWFSRCRYDPDGPSIQGGQEKLQQMQSVCSWEFEVQEDQIGPALRQQCKPVLPIDCLAHRHPQRLEVGAD